jgi:Cu(I)/Ag(I) efflux system membrane protein CusA/SilA
MINSENAMLRGAVLFNVRGRDLGSTVQECKQKLEEMIQSLPKGYYLEWSGQYENQIRATRKLMLIIPIVVLIILLVVYFTYRSFKEALITLITVPFALIGGVYIIYFYGINLSVAVAVGFIALFGMAIETAMLMTIYLNEAMEELVAKKGNTAEKISFEDLHEFVIKGAVKRLRPKIMTVSVSFFGLFPVLWSTGVGSDVMLPITLPLIGGLLTSTIYVLLVTPVIFEITKERELRKHGAIKLVNPQL